MVLYSTQNYTSTDTTSTQWPKNSIFTSSVYNICLQTADHVCKRCCTVDWCTTAAVSAKSPNRLIFVYASGDV